MDTPAHPRHAQPPKPTPPVSARPKKLSVTRIEKLIRDPYAIYAEQVLKLRALEPLAADPGAPERGTLIHEILEAFILDTKDVLPDDAERRLVDIGRDAFGRASVPDGVRAFWWPRFKRIARWFVEFERTRRDAGWQPLALERDAALTFDTFDGVFKLTAKIDRVDVGPGSVMAILDYKTGLPPSKDQVSSGLAPQLTLEAAMGNAGDIDRLAAGIVDQLMYVRLSGGRVEGQAIPLKLDVGEEAEKALEGLKKLIHRYDNEKTPYLSQPRPQFLNTYSDYDHLSRVLEWRNRGRKT